MSVRLHDSLVVLELAFVLGSRGNVGAYQGQNRSEW